MRRPLRSFAQVVSSRLHGHPVFAVIGRWRARLIRGEFRAAREAARSDIPESVRQAPPLEPRDP